MRMRVFKDNQKYSYEIDTDSLNQLALKISDSLLEQGFIRPSRDPDDVTDGIFDALCDSFNHDYLNRN